MYAVTCTADWEGRLGELPTVRKVDNAAAWRGRTFTTATTGKTYSSATSGSSTGISHTDFKYMWKSVWSESYARHVLPQTEMAQTTNKLSAET